MKNKTLKKILCWHIYVDGFGPFWFDCRCMKCNRFRVFHSDIIVAIYEILGKYIDNEKGEYYHYNESPYVRKK